MPEWMERETEGSVPAGVQGCNPLVALIKPLIMEIWFCFTFHTVAHWSVIQIWDLVIFTFFSITQCNTSQSSRLKLCFTNVFNCYKEEYLYKTVRPHYVNPSVKITE